VSRTDAEACKPLYVELNNRKGNGAAEAAPLMVGEIR
jgi:hypothetical protein